MLVQYLGHCCEKRKKKESPSCNIRISNFSKKKKKKKHISNFGQKKKQKDIKKKILSPRTPLKKGYYFSLKSNVECHVGLLYVYIVLQ